MTMSGTTKKLIAGGALVLGGFGAGAALAVTSSASASSDAASGTSGSSNGTGEAPRSFDPSRSVRPDEHLLTGTTGAKVRAAALAEYPRATIQRVETDSDGVYEAHIVTSGGKEVTVQVGESFTVTGVQQGHGPGGPGGPSDGRHWHHDGDRDGNGPSQSAFGA